MLIDYVVITMAGTKQKKKDAEFEGSFHNGERVYGRVLWHPSNELSPGYRLSIEKLYLCAGRDGYVPLFEPNAERPQFGCLENSQRLKYRLLLLVCTLNETNKYIAAIALVFECCPTCYRFA